MLDEPTAALDPPTGHQLLEQVMADARGADRAGGITLIVSHRFSAVRNGHLIVVLEDGRIRESGSHDELIANDGLCAELFPLQAAAYR